jgi:hypothetical protein
MAVAVARRGNGRPGSAGAVEATAAMDRPGAAVEPVELDHEELSIRRGARSGLYCIVAIH